MAKSAQLHRKHVSTKLGFIILAIISLGAIIALLLVQNPVDLRQHAAELPQGKAVKFDDTESNSSITINPPFTTMTPLTVEMWVMPELFRFSTAHLFYRSPALSQTPCSDGIVLLLDRYAAGMYREDFVFTLSLRINNNIYKLTQPTIRNDFNQWMHVAFSLGENNQAKLFVNGKLADTNTLPASPCNPGIGVVLGNTVSKISPYKGLLDNVRISSVVRYESDFTPQKTFSQDENTIYFETFDDGQVQDGQIDGNVQFVDSYIHTLEVSPRSVNVEIKRGKKVPVITITSRGARQFYFNAYSMPRKISWTPQTGSLVPGQSIQISARIDRDTKPGVYTGWGVLRDLANPTDLLQFPIEIRVKR